MQAVAAGARVIHAAARPDGARVVAGDEVLEADHVVWACGAWLPALFGDLLALRITQQDVLFFGAGAEWATPDVPGWVDYDGSFYGLGDLDGRGVKVAPDVEGPPIDVESADRFVVPEHLALARAYLPQRFPALERCAARRVARVPVRDHAGHALRHRPASGAPVGLADGRRLRPRVQAWARFGRAHVRLAERCRCARAAVRFGRAVFRHRFADGG